MRSYNEVAEAEASVARISGSCSNQRRRLNKPKFYGSLYGRISLAEIKLFTLALQAGRLAGAGTQELNAGLLQVKQAFTSGRLAGDELRSVLKNLPALGAEIAAAYDKINGTTGTTVGALRELGAQGKLTNDVLFEAISSWRLRTSHRRQMWRLLLRLLRICLRTSPKPLAPLLLK